MFLLDPRGIPRKLERPLANLENFPHARPAFANSGRNAEFWV